MGGCRGCHRCSSVKCGAQIGHSQAQNRGGHVPLAPPLDPRLMCDSHTSGLGLRPIAGEACGDSFLALQHWRLSISHGLHGHINVGAISVTLNGVWRNHWRQCSLAVITLSVPVSECILHIHAGRHCTVAMAHYFGSRGLGCSSRLLRCGNVSLGKALHLYVHSFDPGVNGYLAGQWLLVWWNNFRCRDGSRGCRLPGELSWYWNEQVL